MLDACFICFQCLLIVGLGMGAGFSCLILFLSFVLLLTSISGVFLCWGLGLEVVCLS